MDWSRLEKTLSHLFHHLDPVLLVFFGAVTITMVSFLGSIWGSVNADVRHACLDFAGFSGAAAIAVAGMRIIGQVSPSSRVAVLLCFHLVRYVFYLALFGRWLYLLAVFMPLLRAAASQ